MTTSSQTRNVEGVAEDDVSFQQLVQEARRERARP
jgi:hypothetical protein